MIPFTATGSGQSSSKPRASGDDPTPIVLARLSIA